MADATEDGTARAEIGVAGASGRPTAERPIDRLLAIMARLRDPDGGCPWDLEQTFATIAPYTIEEAYEVADAIARGDLDDLEDELGDLLLQVVFHARMAEEAGAFGFDDVARAICDKMVRRHPHVFADGTARDPDAVKVRWDEIKTEEKEVKRQRSQRVAEKTGDGERAGLLDDVPIALPALQRAQKLQKRAATVGFDWTDRADVVAKIREEIDELAAAAASEDRDAVEAEVGDLLFAVGNLARHLGIDAEVALRRTNSKFVRRFRFIEQSLADSGESPDGVSLDRMEALWQAAKRLEQSRR